MISWVSVSGHLKQARPETRVAFLNALYACKFILSTNHGIIFIFHVSNSLTKHKISPHLRSRSLRAFIRSDTDIHSCGTTLPHDTIRRA